MPLNDSFDLSASNKSSERNLESEIEMRLKCISGTAPEVVAAITERADFLETTRKNPDAAANVRKKIPDPARVRNFVTLDKELGEEFGFTGRLQSVMDSIDRDFAALEREERLYMKRDLLTLFSPDKQGAFEVDERQARDIIATSYNDFGHASPQAKGFFDKVNSLYNDVTVASDRYFDQLEMQAETARSNKAASAAHRP